MKTKQLYYDNNILTEFAGKILKLEKTDDTGDFRLLLAQTAFYPEGGGQPADRGTIGGCPVVHVKKEKGEIWHYLEDPNGRIEEELTPGAIVAGKIDADYRFDYMQQHTGQHILSAVFMELGGYATVSVHQGEDYTTIEFETPEIDAEFLARAEERANEVICENLPVTLHWTNQAGLSAFSLRRPSKQKENIRIVDIDGVDQVACGGLHLDTTGQAGLVKLTATEKIRGNTRTFWKIGRRALEDYRRKTELTGTLSNLLSVPLDKIEDGIRRVLEESAGKDLAVKETGKKLARLQAEHIYNFGGGPPEADEAGWRIRTEVFDAIDKDVFRNTGLALAEYEGVLFCLLNRMQEGIGWIIGRGNGVEFDFNRVKTDLLGPLGARGGGRPPLWQGGGLGADREQAFIEGWKKLVH